MLVYRVTPIQVGVKAGSAGHPLYLHKPQGASRFDNPDLYDIWYFAKSPECAVGETFGDLERWSDGMFEVPYLPGARRGLVTYQVENDLGLCDLDDPNNLVHLAVRPSQVVERNRPASQNLAKRVFKDPAHRWQGVSWWSFHRPQWTVLALWDINPKSVEVTPLTLRHPAVLDAATLLAKALPTP